MQSRLITIAVGVAAGIFFSGCSTRTAARAVTGTVSVTGKAVVATAKVAGTSAVKVTKVGVGAAAGVGKTAFVTFVNSTTGVARRLPYAQGMKLYAASETAQLNLALKSVQILRGARKIKVGAVRQNGVAADVALQPGDVVRF